MFLLQNYSVKCYIYPLHILCLSLDVDNNQEDLSKEDKVDGDNYDIWHCKIQYLLNEKEVLETLDQ